MFSHIMIGTNDIEKSAEFYTKVLAVLGADAPRLNDAPTGHKRAFFMHDGNIFGLSEPINDEPASCANGMTIGFRCNSPEQVTQLHEAALAAGATAIEAPPGLRQVPMGDMYLCYFRDLDGHKICGIHRVK